MISTTLRLTALHEAHMAAGARMVSYAGYDMPISYAGLQAEHQAVREKVGMFDVSHMGEFMVTGPQALDLIQWISTNDAAKLENGSIQYSCMPNGKGGIVDDLLVYRFAEDRYMLVVNAANRTGDLAWIEEQNRWEANVEDVSDRWALIAVQGPDAAAVMGQLIEGEYAEEMKYYTFREGKVCGKPAIISATGYTGAGGFELYVQLDDALGIWEALTNAGVTPCGLGARDTLRLEAGFCLYGQDIDETTSPLAAGLGWITKFTKDFVDRERFEAEKANGLKSRLRGIRLLERGIPRQGYKVENAKGEVIGRVTSGTMVPGGSSGIGLAYIVNSEARLGDEVHLRIRNKTVRAEVVRPGFLPK